MRQSYTRRFISTIGRLDPELAEKVHVAGERSVPISGPANESAEDQALAFGAFMHHLGADADFRQWVKQGSTSKVPRGHLKAIYRLAITRPPGSGKPICGYSEKQVSNLVRLWVKASRAKMRGALILTE